MSILPVLEEHQGGLNLYEGGRRFARTIPLLAIGVGMFGCSPPGEQPSAHSPGIKGLDLSSAAAPQSVETTAIKPTPIKENTLRSFTHGLNADIDPCASSGLSTESVGAISGIDVVAVYQPHNRRLRNMCVYDSAADATPTTTASISETASSEIEVSSTTAISPLEVSTKPTSASTLTAAPKLPGRYRIVVSTISVVDPQQAELALRQKVQLNARDCELVSTSGWNRLEAAIALCASQSGDSGRRQGQYVAVAIQEITGALWQVTVLDSGREQNPQWQRNTALAIVSQVLNTV